MNKDHFYSRGRPALRQAGFTLIEALLVMSIFIILTGLSTISLLNAKHSSSLSESIDIFISDLKQQQLKAMVGDTEGRAASGNYGVFFGAGTYTLFHGSYSSSEPSNFISRLGDGIQLADITFPGSQVVFLQGSGEINNYTDGSNTIKIKNIVDNNQKTIIINRYGVVTAIN